METTAVLFAERRSLAAEEGASAGAGHCASKARVQLATYSEISAAHEGLVLIGIVPDDVDPELGYIVPGTPLGDGTRRVEEFIEKPPHAIAIDGIAMAREAYAMRCVATLLGPRDCP